MPQPLVCQQYFLQVCFLLVKVFSIPSLPLDQLVQKLSIWYRTFRREVFLGYSWAVSRDIFFPAIWTECADGMKLLRSWFANVYGQCGGQKLFYVSKGMYFNMMLSMKNTKLSSHLGYFAIGCRNLEARPVQKKKPVSHSQNSNCSLCPSIFPLYSFFHICKALFDGC